MKTTARTLLLLIAMLASIATATAQTQSYRLKVGPFDRLKITDNVNVVYHCAPDSAGYVTWHGDKEFADAFIFTNNKGQLRVQVSTDDVDMPGLPTLHIYSDFLTEVENFSDFNTTVNAPAPSPQFKAIQIGNGTITVNDLRATKVTAAITTGNGTVTLSGTCQEATLRMVGTGVIAADRLRAGTVNCRILGSGTIGCSPSATLNVKGIGSTKIYYTGNPTVKKSGGGKLFQLRQETPGGPTDTIPEE